MYTYIYLSFFSWGCFSFSFSFGFVEFVLWEVGGHVANGELDSVAATQGKIDPCISTSPFTYPDRKELVVDRQTKPKADKSTTQNTTTKSSPGLRAVTH